jgi:hypothetical protein
MFTEPLSSNGPFRIATEMRVYRSNLALASRWPAIDIHSDFIVPAFRLSDTLVTGTCLAKRCPAMDYSGFQA